MRDFATGPKLGRFTPRRIFVEAGVMGMGAGMPLIGQEAIGPAADHFLELHARRNADDSFRHDKGVARRQRIQHLPERTLQHNLEAAVVDRAHLSGDAGDGLAERILFRPTLQRGDAVTAAHRLVVMEQQAWTQRDRPGQLVLGDLGALGHLGMRLQPEVNAEQRVPHHVAVGERDHRKAPQRIDRSEIGTGHEAQGFGCGLRQCWARQSAKQRCGGQTGGTRQKMSTPHHDLRVAAKLCCRPLALTRPHDVRAGPPQASPRHLTAAMSSVRSKRARIDQRRPGRTLQTAHEPMCYRETPISQCHPVARWPSGDRHRGETTALGRSLSLT
jgi:hypothetical protein